VRVRAKEASFDRLAVDLCSGFYILFYIGADFHGAMVATAPREKLFIRRRPPPCDELDPSKDIKLVFVQKIAFVLRKINKNCCHAAALFDSNMYQIVCRLGLLGSLQRSPRPLAVFRGPTSKGRGQEGRGEEGRGRGKE